MTSAEAVSRLRAALPESIRSSIADMQMDSSKLVVTWARPFAFTEALLIEQAWRDLVKPVVVHTFAGMQAQAGKARVQQERLPV